MKTNHGITNTPTARLSGPTSASDPSAPPTTLVSKKATEIERKTAFRFYVHSTQKSPWGDFPRANSTLRWLCLYTSCCLGLSGRPLWETRMSYGSQKGLCSRSKSPRQTLMNGFPICLVHMHLACRCFRTWCTISTSCTHKDKSLRRYRSLYRFFILFHVRCSTVTQYPDHLV